MTRGFVYVFTNEAMPGIVKIGHTNDIFRRLEELSRASGVPRKFECHFAIEVDNCKEVEKKIHKGLDDLRFDSSREFFRIAPERVKYLLQLTEHRVYKTETDENDNEITKAAISRKLNLKGAGLKKGNILTFSNDQCDISVTVEKSSSVLFNGAEMSLAKATSLAFQEIGDKWRTGSAAEYWFFKEELLSEIIRRIDPLETKRSFTFNDTFPIIAKLINDINRKTNSYASHAQIVECLLKNGESKKFLEVSLKLSRFQTPKEIAVNQVAWWSQQITQGSNPFQDRFERRKKKNLPFEYWDKELGDPPE